jgi:SAM-dependent methyltransferase
MERPDWAPEGIDTERFSAARVYDYMLGGSHNFAVDREFARQILEFMPDTALQAQANRAFLHRAVRYLAEAGARQFLDIGSGIPTRGNVHEIAQKIAPEARVVYVDVDPVAVAHSRQILADNDLATAIQQDLRRPDAILDHPEVRALLDPGQPIAVLLMALLHAIPDADEPHRIVARIRDRLAPGSYLAISHGTPESRPEELRRLAEASGRGGYSLTPRPRADVLRFFDGFELVEPGLVWAPEWRPEHVNEISDDPSHSNSLAGVGRKQP